MVLNAPVGGQVSTSPAGDRSFSTRPAFPIAVALVIGIAVHRLVPATPGIWLLVCGTLALGLIGLLQRPRVFAIGALCTVFFLGIAAAQLFAFYFPGDHIALFATDTPRLAMVEARVASSPRLFPSAHGKDGQRQMQFEAVAIGLQTIHGWEQASGKLQVMVGQEVAGLSAGQVVRLTGTLQRPLPASNPGQFDWAKFGRSQRVLAEFSVQHASAVQVLPGRGWTPFVSLRLRARSALDAGFAPAAAVDRELLAALIFGDRGKELADVEEAFRRTGTTHLLASNGLRVAILASGLYFFCVLLAVHPRKSVWIVTAFVATFAFLTLPAPQAIRPALLCTAAGIALAAGRSVDSVQLLSLAGLLILALNPLDLYDAGFQLSFVTVLGLMLFAGPISRWLAELESPHSRVARTLPQASVLFRFRMFLWDRARQLLAASLVAWLIATPLVAYQFEQFNPWSIPLAVILSPLVFVSMIAGFVKICLTLTLPWFAVFWATIAQIPAAALNHTVLWLAKVPGADVPKTSPAAQTVLLYYALLCIPALAASGALVRFLGRLRPPRVSPTFLRWTGRISSPAMALTLLFLPITPRVSPPPGTLQLTLLSVGAGQTAVVELPDGSAILIDCGSSTLSDDLRQCLAPFLRHEGRSGLHAIYLSHGDYDHISAAQGAATEYDVREVFISPNFRTHARESATAEGLLESLDAENHPAQALWNHQRIPLGSGATLEVLWPPERSSLNSNNSALVLKLTYAGRSILFPADIQAPAERDLLRKPEELRSDILIAPHHGSREESTADFIAAVHPQYILSSNANRLTQKQKAFDELSSGCPLYRTNKCGALTVRIDAKGNIDVRGFLRLREERGR